MDAVSKVDRYLAFLHAAHRAAEEMQTLVESMTNEEHAMIAERLEYGELSDREALILKEIAMGHSIVTIAARLNVSTKTLETFKARGFTKLNIADRHGLYKFAARCGWLLQFPDA